MYKIVAEVREHMLDPGRPAESKQSFPSPHWAVLWAITTLGADYGKVGCLFWLVIDEEGNPQRVTPQLN